MTRRGRPPHPDILTPREWEVLALLREGLSNPEIADRMAISRDGVKYHVSEILGKLGLGSREEAAAWRPEEGRPWWMTAFAPVPFLWRRAGGVGMSLSGLALAASGVLLLAIVVGLGLIAFLLLRGDGNGVEDAGSVIGGEVELPLVLDGDRLGISSLDGEPPTELAGPGDYAGVRFDPDGRLLFVKRKGKDAGFYRMDDDEPKLAVPLPSLVTVSSARWSPDGSRAAWIERDGDMGSLRIAEPGGEPDTVSLENAGGLCWSPDGRWLLAWTRGGDDTRAFRVDVDDPGSPTEVSSDTSCSSSAAGDVLALEDFGEQLMREVVLTKEDGSGRRVLGLAYAPRGGPATAPVFSPDGRWLAWRNATNEAGDFLGLVVAATDGSMTVTPSCQRDACEEGSRGTWPVWSPDGRHLAWSQSGRVFVAETDVWEGRLAAEGSVRFWSPDGKRLAYVREDGENTTLYARRLDGSGDEVTVVELEDDRSLWEQAAWSPDGARLVVPLQIPEQVHIYSLDTQTGELWEPPVPLPYPATERELLALAPDGSALAYAELGGEMSLVTLAGDERVLDLTEAGRIPTDWSDDGAAVLFVGDAVKTLNLQTGEVERLLEGNIQTAVWSPDRSRVAFIRDQRVGVLDVASREAETIAPDLDTMLVSNSRGTGYLSWSPDGERIAFADWRVEEPVTQGGSDVYIVDADGGNLRRLTDSPRAKRHFHWSPDGKHLAYLHTLEGGNHLKVIDVDAGAELSLDIGGASDPHWADADEMIVDVVYQGVAVVTLDGTLRLLVADVYPCQQEFVGFADGKLFFTSRCTHAGL